jgi:ABC-type polar amino acid transport system ATPase subunit
MGITVQDLCKTFRRDDRRVLDHVTLEVRAGSLAALMGPSGAGKSTLLKCLVGLEPFDSGSIQVAGVKVQGLDVLSPHRHAQARKSLQGNVGMVFQSLDLFPHLTALQNCTLAPVEVARWTARAATEKAMELLNALGIADKAQQFPDELSGGQRQRVALARALAMEPRVLVYDEPTSALDVTTRADVLKAIAGVRSRGVTQLLVVHDPQVARECADVVYVLHQGHVVETGPPAEVLSAPRHDATRRVTRES